VKLPAFILASNAAETPAAFWVWLGVFVAVSVVTVPFSGVWVLPRD
jgi:hypothetical protein